MNWNEMDIFKGIDLNDSFVMSWHLGANELIFMIEASIWSESQYYENSNNDEYTCYKPAILKFINLKEINGLIEMSQVTASTDATGEKDYGNIENLQKTNEGFLLEGDFGSVSIVGGELSFEVKKT